MYIIYNMGFDSGTVLFCHRTLVAIVSLSKSPLTLNQQKHFALRPMTVTHCVVE